MRQISLHVGAALHVSIWSALQIFHVLASKENQRVSQMKLNMLCTHGCATRVVKQVVPTTIQRQQECELLQRISHSVICCRIILKKKFCFHVQKFTMIAFIIDNKQIVKLQLTANFQNGFTQCPIQCVAYILQIKILAQKATYIHYVTLIKPTCNAVQQCFKKGELRHKQV